MKRRAKKEVQEERQPSPLFEQPGKRTPDTEHIGRRDIRRYATPMARRLVKVAAYLDAQLLMLQQGSDIDSRQLSRNADRLGAAVCHPLFVFRAAAGKARDCCCSPFAGFSGSQYAAGCAQGDRCQRAGT